jgi:hypothetical protein
MKQVSISLKPEIAKAYLQASEEDRRKVNDIVNRWLKNIFFRKKESREKLFEVMNDIGMEAKASQLTPEILDRILSEIKEEISIEKD